MRVEWFCLLRFVPDNSHPIGPNSRHPKRWHLRVYWHSSFGLAKASKVRAATWHMICNSWREMPGSIFYIQIVGEENHRFSVPKKTMASLPTTTVLLTRSVGCKNWSGSNSVAKSAGSWVQEKIERDTAALNLHSFTHGMPLVHWSNIITSVHRPPQKLKRFRVEMVMGKYSMFWPSTNNDKKVLKGS
jgi:hypothetical protein